MNTAKNKAKLKHWKGAVFGPDLTKWRTEFKHLIISAFDVCHWRMRVWIATWKRWDMMSIPSLTRMSPGEILAAEKILEGWRSFVVCHLAATPTIVVQLEKIISIKFLIGTFILFEIILVWFHRMVLFQCPKTLCLNARILKWRIYPLLSIGDWLLETPASVTIL